MPSGRIAPYRGINIYYDITLDLTSDRSCIKLSCFINQKALCWAAKYTRPQELDDIFKDSIAKIHAEIDTYFHAEDFRNKLEDLLA